MNCCKNYEDLLDTRIHKAVENDPSHTKNLSESYFINSLCSN